jgi:hypothetical protein
MGPRVTTREKLDRRSSAPTCRDRQRMGCTGRVIRLVGRGRFRQSRTDEPGQTLTRVRPTRSDGAPGLSGCDRSCVCVSSQPSLGTGCAFYAPQNCRTLIKVYASNFMPKCPCCMCSKRRSSRLNLSSHAKVRSTRVLRAWNRTCDGCEGRGSSVPYIFRRVLLEGQLWGVLSGWRADEHRLCGIDRQSGDQPAPLQEATDSLNAAQCPFAAADPDPGLEW